MIYPKCSHCQREFRPGTTWQNANFCRALFLFETLLRHEQKAQTTWMLCQETSLPYQDAIRAMQKLREYGLVTVTDEEKRPGGGQRFWYVPVTQDKESWRMFAAKLSPTT